MKYEIKFGRIDILEKQMIQQTNINEPALTFNFNFNVDLRINPEGKWLAALTDINILDINSFKWANFKTACYFEFPDFENIFKKNEEDKYDVPIDIEILLKSTGLSTTRGIIYGELRGTYLHNVVLPFIDIPTLVNENRKELTEKKPS